MELTPREKFIAHYIMTISVGLTTKQSDMAIDKTLTKLMESRSRKLSNEEANQTIRLLNEEFLLSGSLLSTLNGEFIAEFVGKELDLVTQKENQDDLEELR